MKLIYVAILSVVFISCTPEEKKLGEDLKSIKVNLPSAVEGYYQEGLTLETLTLIKNYSDPLYRAKEVFSKSFKDNAKRNRLKKHLLKNEQLDGLCSSYLLDQDTFEAINAECQLDYFNVCPFSFSNYKQSKIEILKFLKNVVGDSLFEQTNCQQYFY